MSLTALITLVFTMWDKAKGWRTYLMTWAAVLTQLAAFFGMIPTSWGQTLTIVFGGLGVIALRQSQRDHAISLGETLTLVKQLETVLAGNPLPPDPVPTNEPPATIPFAPAATTGILLLGLLCFAQVAGAQDRPTVPTAMQLSESTRAWYRNPDGSCVQCSIGMAGVHCNDINAASLLWDTEYGPAVRGGSGPSRVEAYCDQRGIQAWSVTGATVEDTIPWMVWAARTGRFAAIGAGRAHFQTLYGYDPGDERPWRVCNNNSTQRIDRYTDREFKQLHAASGPWVVILQRASSDPPIPTKWWK